MKPTSNEPATYWNPYVRKYLGPFVFQEQEPGDGFAYNPFLEEYYSENDDHVIDTEDLLPLCRSKKKIGPHEVPKIVVIELTYCADGDLVVPYDVDEVICTGNRRTPQELASSYSEDLLWLICDQTSVGDLQYNIPFRIDIHVGNEKSDFPSFPIDWNDEE